MLLPANPAPSRHSGAPAGMTEGGVGRHDEYDPIGSAAYSGDAGQDS